MRYKLQFVQFRYRRSKSENGLQVDLLWIFGSGDATNTSRRYLRSATHGDLLVPKTRTVTHGPRSFAVSGPTVWNTFDPACIDHYPRTVSEWTKDNTVSFGIRCKGAFVTV